VKKESTFHEQKGWLCQSEVGGETLVLLSGLAVRPWTSTWQDFGGALSIYSQQHWAVL
jgi:hypothetical protein